MKRTLLAAALLGAGLLSACSMTGPGNLQVHEAVLYGGAQERVVWVYGTLQGSQSSVKLGAQTVDLRAQVADPIATPGSLSVNGRATFRVATGVIPAPVSVLRLDATQFRVTPGTGTPPQAIYYTDGQTWTRLNGTSGQVTGTRVEGLRGAGQLTDDEARVLSDTLRPQGPLAVAVLTDQQAPGLTVEPTPTEHLRTDLYVLSSVPTAQATRPTTGGTVTFITHDSGSNAATDTPAVQLAVTATEARSLYARAFGRQSSVPTPPVVTGRTLIGVFLGQRPTGGYGVQVLSASGGAGTLTLRVRVTAPGAGAITAQVLTSPWTIVSVPGLFRTVQVVDENGQPLPGLSTTAQDR